MTKQARSFAAGGTAFSVLLALGLSHMLNDTLQTLIAAIYPLIKQSLTLSFSQIGLITLVFQFSSSVFQPVVGWYTDKKPQPYSLPVGMTSTLCGLFLLAFSNSLGMVLISVTLIGIGSSIFHPEASRLAYLASGGRPGLAQSIFQVGGNLGGSLGPLLAALVIAPFGQRNVAWFTVVALLCIGVMFPISRWYKRNLYFLRQRAANKVKEVNAHLSHRKIVFSLCILLILIFSKYVYLASINSYYTFYLIHKFGISVQASQFYLFAFLFSVAVGTLVGGPIGDKVGRKYVIWVSILGAAPFTLAMPYMGLTGTCIMSIFIGLIISSAFSAILVYAQELLPGKVGMIAGLFFGLAFGIAGIASAVLGNIADDRGIEYVYHVCSWLLLIGIVTGFLPNLGKRK
ncbi:MFS transporter [Coprobacter secundus]|uniref:MFS transporter n=1 Tax=Coprobacter secundus subsp. similis TaxID=2751153 RepID=A0A7G1I2U3_9BACT|nr:MFS transporter [Coprobacter secundus]BCI63897.1 MFS transporter [Coprobacter secundus subsp. similis]